MEEKGGLGRVDGEGDEVAHQADDVPLVPQAGHDSGGIFSSSMTTKQKSHFMWLPYHCAENGESRSLAHCRVDFFILSGLVLPVVGQPETS